MRVLHAISGIDPSNGGPTQALLGLTAAQRRAGHDVHVVATWKFQPGFDNAQTFRAAGVEVTMVGPAHGPFSRHPQLAATVRGLVDAADVVHVHSVWEEAQHQAMVAARRAGKPFVVRTCNALSAWSMRRSLGVRLRKQLYFAWRLRRNLNAAAAIHYTIEQERAATEWLGLKAPAIVEPNGVGLAPYATLPARVNVDATFPALAGRRYVLFVGRIASEKGLDLLVPATATLPDDVRVVIAGPEAPPGYLPIVQGLIEEHGLGERVLLVGPVAGALKVALQAHATVGVLPSYTENFGIAAVESLAAGVPVVVTEGVNLAGLIADADVGRVVPPTVAGVADGLNDMLSHPDQRARCAAKAQPLVRSRFDWEQIAQRWTEHYRSMVSA